MADGNSISKLQIDVVVNDKEAKQQLSNLTRSFNSFQKTTASGSKGVKQISQDMRNVAKESANAKREAGQFIESVKRNSKNILPSDLYGKSIEQYKKQLSSAQDKMKAIMSSSTPDRQLKGLERYTIQAQMARNAIEALGTSSRKFGIGSGNNFYDKPGWYQAKEMEGKSDVSLPTSAPWGKEYSFKNDINEFIDNYVKGYDDVKEKAKQVSSEVSDLEFMPTKLKDGQSYTKTYVDLEKQITKAEQKLESLLIKQELLEGSNKETQRYKKLEFDIQQADKNLKALNYDMKELQASGGDVNTVNTSMQKLSNTASNVSSVMSKLATSFRAGGLRGMATTLQSGSRNIGQLSKGLEEASKGAEGLSGSLAGIGSAIPVIGLVVGAITLLISVAKKAAKAISNAFSSVVNGVKSFVNSISKTIDKMFAPITKVVKKFLNTLRNTIIRRAVTAIIKDIGSAFESLDVYSNNVGTNFHKNFQLLKADLQYLGRSIVAAFEPLINFAAPVIDFVVQKIVTAINAINQFISALTGSSTWTKATYSATGYEDAVSGAAAAQSKLNKQLQKFDELNNITTNDSGGSGGGASNGASGEGWSTEDVSSAAKNLAEKFKEAWKTADFTEIGSDVATKIQEALNKINWDKVQASAIKLGSAFATFLNGFFGKDGFANDVGNAIANGINAAINLIYTFTSIIKGDVIGDFVGTVIVKAIKGIKWEKLKESAGNIGEELAKGIGALLDSGALEEISKAVANLVKTGIEGFYKFVTTFNFEKAGKSIGDAINSFIKEMNKAGSDGLTGWEKLGTTISTTAIGLEKALISLIDSVDKKKLGDGVMSVITSIDWLTLIKDSLVLKKKIEDGILGLLVKVAGVVATAPLELAVKLPGAQSVFDSFVESWNGIKNKAVEIGVKVDEKAKDALIAVKDAWNAIKKGTKKIGIKISIIGQKAFEKIKGLWDKITSKEISITFNDAFTKSLKGAWNALVKSVNKAIDTLNKIPYVNISKMQELKKNGGSYYGGSWHNISQYANGAPAGVNHGTMFVAGEAGAEVVGNIGGRTEVLNQSQLASAMYSAVFSAMRNASGSQQPLQVYLDGKVVFDSTRQYANDYTRRTGNPAFI